jgi:protein ImuB
MAITLPNWTAWCAARVARRTGEAGAGDAGAGDVGAGDAGAGERSRRGDANGGDGVRDDDALARTAERALVRCAQWCMRWTPRVHVERLHGPPAVLLDLTGCLPAHGGLARVRRRVTRGLQRRHVVHTVAVSHTAGGALALGLALAVAEGPFEARASLPIESLRLAPDTLRGLRELHLRTVGQLAAIDRGALADRFGAAVLERLDALTGARPWAFLAVPAPDDARGEFVFASPCAQLEAVQQGMRHAVTALCAELDRRVRCASAIEVCVQRAGLPRVRGVLHLGVPTRDAAHLARLLAPRIERMPLGCTERGMGVECIALRALRLGSLCGDASHQAVWRMVDQLRGRLGEGSVRPAEIA